MDELRFRAQQSPRNDGSVGSFVTTPNRNGAVRLSQPTATHDLRSSLPRRFTTESGRVPTLSNITSQRAPDAQELATSTALQKVQLLEKKRQEYERLREQKRRFEAEMQRLDQQQRREEQELAAMQEDLGHFSVASIGAATSTTGHQSEPTTPPEYRDTSTGFPSMFSRPNRYSTSSLTSTTSLLGTRPGRSGSQIASPQSGIMQSASQQLAFDDQLPSRSVPGSRRNSDEDEKEEAVRQDPTSHRSTNALNRYSMPVTRSKTGFYDFSLDQTNTTRFLFGEEEDQSNGEVKLYQSNNNATASGLDESFPTLTRREGQPNMLSASSAALDLALSQAPNSDAITANGWGGVNRHRTQAALAGQMNGTTPVASGGQATSSVTEVGNIGGPPSSLRHSFDMKYYTESSSDAMSSPTNTVLATPKLQTSYSANDVSTIKSTPGSAVSSNTNNHAQQYLHNHNASLGRIPAGVIPSRHSRELSATEVSSAVLAREFASITSALQGGAAPFGPGPVAGNGTTQAPVDITPGVLAAAAAAAAASTSTVTNIPPATVGNHFIPGYYGGGPNYNIPVAATVAAPGPSPYIANGLGNNGMGVNGMGVNGMGANGMGVNGMPMLSQTMQALSLNGAGPIYPAQGYNGYPALYAVPNNGPVPSSNQIRDSQARVIQNRRQIDNDAMNRYNNTSLESVSGSIYELCKDQHGCRYLQKQLENRRPDQVHMIFLETNQHVVELMTDPFGNYLCQKLFEYCNDEERTVLIQNAAQDMVRIALNQHGTRALQKMIEFISTDSQVQIIIEALRHRVVDLIQDLNGNHVIQKCLNKLSPANAQFIFDAVGTACVEVGTHRHGCCVLQRCIDHASGDQKDWLIQRITDQAVALIKDPFGNYVVQYIIDLNDSKYTEPLVAQFRGLICSLSRHKFSSNVVEKCLRCSLEPSRDTIVEELLTPGEIDRLLRDSYANYVIQTALEYATPYMKVRLVECIRPFLPQIRSTPYGRRIQAKIQTYDSRSGQSSGHITPAESSQGQIPLHTNSNRNSLSNMSNGANNGNGNNSASNTNTNTNGTAILIPTSAFSTNGINGNGNNHRAGGATSMTAAVPGGMVNKTATGSVAPPMRPVTQFAPTPAYARPAMMQGNPVAGGITMVPVMQANLPPIGSTGIPGGMGPGMGIAVENGETAWL